MFQSFTFKVPRFAFKVSRASRFAFKVQDAGLNAGNFGFFIDFIKIFIYIWIVIITGILL